MKVVDGGLLVGLLQPFEQFFPEHSLSLNLWRALPESKYSLRIGPDKLFAEDLDTSLRIARGEAGIRAIDHVVAQHNLVHGGAQKATDRLGRRTYDRLVFVQ